MHVRTHFANEIVCYDIGSYRKFQHCLKYNEQKEALFSLLYLYNKLIYISGNCGILGLVGTT